MNLPILFSVVYEDNDFLTLAMGKLSMPRQSSFNRLQGGHSLEH
jgi:hypothetical protein